MAITTIKVPTELRDRISANAQARDLTVAQFLKGVLDQWEREQRMAAMKYAIQRTNPEDMADYLREVDEIQGPPSGDDVQAAYEYWTGKKWDDQ